MTDKRIDAIRKAVRELRYDEMLALSNMITSWMPTVGDDDDNARNLADELSNWASQIERQDIRLVKSDRP